MVKESIPAQSGSRGINRSHCSYTACFPKCFYSSSKPQTQQLSSLKTLSYKHSPLFVSFANSTDLITVFPFPEPGIFFCRTKSALTKAGLVKYECVILFL